MPCPSANIAKGGHRDKRKAKFLKICINSDCLPTLEAVRGGLLPPPCRYAMNRFQARRIAYKGWKTCAGKRAFPGRENENWFSVRLPRMGAKKKYVRCILNYVRHISNYVGHIFCPVKTALKHTQKMRTKYGHAPRCAAPNGATPGNHPCRGGLCVDNLRVRGECTLKNPATLCGAAGLICYL